MPRDNGVEPASPVKVHLGPQPVGPGREGRRQAVRRRHRVHPADEQSEPLPGRRVSPHVVRGGVEAEESGGFGYALGHQKVPLAGRQLGSAVAHAPNYAVVQQPGQAPVNGNVGLAQDHRQFRRVHLKWRVHQIIDGQQQCEALKKFIYGDLQLLEVADEASKLPAFLRDTERYPCPWSGQRYITLPEELRDQLNNTELETAFIKDADDAEVRDLFIRLQSGSPLNNQEKRDAYPGDFTDFILKLGGKDSLRLNCYSILNLLTRLRLLVLFCQAA